MNARFERRSAQGIVVAVLSAFLVGIEVRPDTALSATLMSQEQATQVVSIRNLTVKDGAVAGELVNKSPRTIRDVQLLIRYTWLWNNEMRPGEESPGDAVYVTVEGDIPSGGSKPFTYRPAAPLPARTDGRFDVSVALAGYAEIIPQK